MNESAKIALQQYQEKVANGEIERTVVKSVKEKWEEDKKSLRKSINFFCVQCFGNCIRLLLLINHGVNNEIRNCTSKDCALYHVQPYK